MKRITVLLPAAARPTVEALGDLQEEVGRRTGLGVLVAHVPSLALLPQILERTPEAVAWAPAYLAFVLARMQVATPLLAVARQDVPARSAVLVGRSGIAEVADLKGCRIGWVSHQSTTGYDLPRLYLESLGLEVDSLFGVQRFCATHAAAVEALARGDVDVVATHSGVLARHAELGAGPLASIGPVPADVLVGGGGVGSSTRARLLRGLHSLSVGPYSLGHVQDGHLALFEELHRRASEPASGKTRISSRRPVRRRPATAPRT